MGKICKIDGISMRKEIDQDGTILYYNENNEFHREDGPAIEFTNGYKEWYKNGKHHREDGPAVEYVDGTKIWYKNGKIHREDGPAVEYVDGHKLYYYNNISYSDIKTNKDWIRFVKLMVFQ